MFDSINDKLSDRSFIQSAIHSSNKLRDSDEEGNDSLVGVHAETEGPHGRGGMSSPFEKFRTMKVERTNRTMSSSRSSSNSHTTTSYEEKKKMEDEEIDAPSHINPEPTEEAPDLFKSEFEDDEEGEGAEEEEETNPDGTAKDEAKTDDDGVATTAPDGKKKPKGKGGKGHGKGTKGPSKAGLHKKHGGVKISGGSKSTGKKKKPSFNFGPPAPKP
jgi:hypothetical protein